MFILASYCHETGGTPQRIAIEDFTYNVSILTPAQYAYLCIKYSPGYSHEVTKGLYISAGGEYAFMSQSLYTRILDVLSSKSLRRLHSCLSPGRKNNTGYG